MQTITKDKDRNIELHHVTWRGIGLEISFERNWLNSASKFNTAHVEVRSINPERAPLPITETGYRSHFTTAESVDAGGGAVACIMAALDKAAEDKSWRQREAASRQLALF